MGVDEEVVVIVGHRPVVGVNGLKELALREGTMGLTAHVILEMIRVRFSMKQRSLPKSEFQRNNAIGLRIAQDREHVFGYIVHSTLSRHGWRQKPFFEKDFFRGRGKIGL